MSEIAVRLIMREWRDDKLQVVDVREFTALSLRSDGNPSGELGTRLREMLRNMVPGQLIELSMRIVPND